MGPLSLAINCEPDWLRSPDELGAGGAGGTPPDESLLSV